MQKSAAQNGIRTIVSAMVVGGGMMATPWLRVIEPKLAVVSGIVTGVGIITTKIRYGAQMDCLNKANILRRKLEKLEE